MINEKDIISHSIEGIIGIKEKLDLLEEYFIDYVCISDICIKDKEKINSNTSNGSYHFKHHNGKINQKIYDDLCDCNSEVRNLIEVIRSYLNISHGELNVMLIAESKKND